MPVLAAFIGALISKIVDFFTSLASKRLLVAAAALAFFYAALTILFSRISPYLNAFVLQQPQILQYGFSMLPSNTDDCISIALTTRLYVYIYNTHIKSMQLKFKGF